MQLQKELSHKRYEPIWAMMHKIRRVMSKQQESIIIKNYAELDDAFFDVKTNKTRVEEEVQEPQKYW